MSDFESLIFWSKFRVLGTALKRFSQFVFFNLTSRSDRHFYSPSPPIPPPHNIRQLPTALIGHSFPGMHILHLMNHGAGEVALNFVKRIRPILNSGSAKQKLKEVHSKIRSF